METKTLQENLKLARQFYVAFDSRLPEQMDGLFDENAIDHDGQSGDEPALPNMRGLVAALAGGFAEYRHEIQLLLGAEEKVVIRWRFTGTHTGDFFGAPASGKKVTFHGHDILRFENGRIVELWHVEQLFQMFNQIQAK